MTPDELYKEFIKSVNGSVTIPLPDKWEVDEKTYLNCMDLIINTKITEGLFTAYKTAQFKMYAVDIMFGPNKGLMFKGVELVVRKEV